MQRNRVHRDCDRPGENASAADPSDGTSDDQGDRTGRSTADRGANLEHQDAGEEDGFDAVYYIQFPEEELEGTVGEEVGRAVPADVLHRMELVGDLGDGGRNYEPVLYFHFQLISLSVTVCEIFRALEDLLSS